MGRRRILACLLLLIAQSALAYGASVRGASATEIRFPVQVADGESMTATLRLPRPPWPGERFPVLLIFGGFESAGRVLDLVRSDAAVALASFDYPFSAPRRFEWIAGLKSLPQLKTLFPKTERGIAELVAALRARPDVDASKVVLVGASFGSPFALAAAARDPSISGLALVHGFGHPVETLEHVILRGWRPKYGALARPLAWVFGRVGWWFLGAPRPEELAARLASNQQVLMITAERDSFIPRESSDALWEAVQGSRAVSSRKLMATDHLMPGAEATVHEIVEEVLSWMERVRLGGVRPLSSSARDEARDSKSAPSGRTSVQNGS